MEDTNRPSFESTVVDLAKREVWRDGRRVHVEPRAFDVLAFLIAERHRVVSKHEILLQVWGHTYVSEWALTTRVKDLRRAIGDDGRSQRLIRTLRGTGYRFVGDVRFDGDLPGGHRSSSASAAPPQGAIHEHRFHEDRRGGDIRWCRTRDGVRLAYAVSGSGPPLVRTPGWIGHLQHDWENPVWRHWLEALATKHQLVCYDGRGSGLSDWDVGRFGFEDWIVDLETIVDDLALDTFPLIGVSQGGAVAVAYACRNPDRVSRLVLVSTYARGRVARATTAAELAEAAVHVDLARVGWNADDEAFRQVFTSHLLPDASRATWAAFNEFQRRAAAPDNAARFMEVFGEIDVTELAPGIVCPTLVVHSRDDQRISIDSARDLAASIPDARLAVVPSRNHLLVEGEPGARAAIDEIERFFASSTP